MKTIIFLFSIFTCSFNQIIAQDNLSISIKGLTNDTIFMIFSSLDNPQKEELKILISENGVCHYRFPDDNKYLVTLQPKSITKYKKNERPIFGNSSSISHILITPDSRIKIDGYISDDKYLEYEVTGSDALDEFSRHRKNYKELEIQLDSINQCIELASSNEERNLLFKSRAEISKIINSIKSSYIQKHIDNKDESNIDLISRYLSVSPNLYMQFSASINPNILKESEYAPVLRILEEMLKDQKGISDKNINIQKGKAAPNFILKKINNEDLELSSFKGKYIILDFWGSWCPPCIKDIPKLEAYSKKYMDKVVFISINCEDSDEVWRRTVKKNNMDWIQVINNKENNKDVVALYGVKTFPFKLIIDKEGNILDIFEGTESTFFSSLDSILAID